MIKKAYDFDSVFDCQAVFRKLLEAFSNPGRVVDISLHASKLRVASGPYVAVAATLMDNETGFCVVGDDALAGAVQQFTYACPEKLEESGFVFVLSPCDEAQMKSILSAVPAGTMAEPHRSGVLFVRVEGFSSNPSCRLKGPGIDGAASTPLGPYAESWIRARREVSHEYPSGVDIAFITDAGQVVAAPRLVQLAR
jgi:alpha-D-ribose 1-methylphosphonate 5-triphosphate synthase subunit PhnH